MGILLVFLTNLEESGLPLGTLVREGKNADRALALSKEHGPKSVTSPALERCRGTAAACLASRSLAAAWESDADDFIGKKKVYTLDGQRK